MEYKEIIKNQETRFRILKFLKFVPDQWMVKLQYRVKVKRKLNLKNPQRYSEKLQWYKINFRSPLMTQCADKYRVRDHVRSKGLGNILSRLYAVYDNANEIDFEVLPQKFVMKTTNGSGTNIFCKNKMLLMPEELLIIKKNLNNWLKRDFFSAGREWSYKNIMPKIIVEEYLEDKSNLFNGINDYKFLCFNGVVKYIVLDVDRQLNHKRNIYDYNWNFIDVNTDHPNFGDCVTQPEGLEEMKKIAAILAKDFPCVRVDLYWVNNKVYFGELTFYPWTGYVNFNPDEFDYILGRQFILPEINK